MQLPEEGAGEAEGALVIQLMQDESEHPIPTELRALYRLIADAFASGDFGLVHNRIEGVQLADNETAEYISDCVQDYGDPLAGLDESTWETSCYTHMSDHWEALVDLATRNEPVSDLTLHTRIYLDPNLRIVIDSVHVP